MLEKSCFDCKYCHEYRTDTCELRTFCGMLRPNFPVGTKCILFESVKKTESGDGKED